MERYSLIHTKLPREFVLLQGTGCRWRRCSFCDYHTDVSVDPFVINREVLARVQGTYGVLDVINSGSGTELDEQTLTLLEEVVRKRGIHTLWFEMVTVKFRCGVETFNGELRQLWNKGIAPDVTPQDIARYFQGVCLLCCTEGESKERILTDIATARQYFEYFSVNLFCNNTTALKRDEALATWFEQEVYPHLKEKEGIEVLLNNVDLGVGE